MTAPPDPEARPNQAEPHELEGEGRDAGVAIPVDAAVAADVLAEELVIEAPAEDMTNDHDA